MNNEAPQKLQRDGMEREARELMWKLKPHTGCDYDEIGIGSYVDRDDVVPLMVKFASRCANEARLEALEQAAAIAEDEWKLDERNEGHPEFQAKYGTVEVADEIRALKAEPVPPPKPAREG